MIDLLTYWPILWSPLAQNFRTLEGHCLGAPWMGRTWESRGCQRGQRVPAFLHRLTPSNPYEIGIKMARSSTKPCFVAVRVTVIFWEGIAIEQIHLEHGTWIAASICLNGSVWRKGCRLPDFAGKKPYKTIAKDNAFLARTPDIPSFCFRSFRFWILIPILGPSGCPLAGQEGTPSTDTPLCSALV